MRHELESILGSENVYFEPASSYIMTYPCIVYTREDAQIQYADNKVHTHRWRYQITYISWNPYNDVVDAMLDHFEAIEYGRHFVNSNLHHDVLYLYW